MHPTAVSFVVHTRILYKLFTCQSEPAFIYKQHLLLPIRRHKNIGIMCDLAVD